MKNHRSGNVLFLILIAIFLLGGLTVLLARTSNTTEETGSTEQASIQASQILNYAANLGTAVQSLLTSGCSENQISFYYADEPNATPNDYLNPSAIPACELFGTSGSGLTYKQTPPAARVAATSYNARSHFSGVYCVNGIGTHTTTGCVTSQTELVYMASNLTREVCIALNNRVGVVMTGGEPPVDEIGIVPFVGSYTQATNSLDGLYGDDSTSTALPLKGKKSGCARDSAGTTSGQYIFYHVLHAR